MSDTAPQSRARPLVSIVVPSFNQGRFIGETIRSILEQRYTPIEVIVIDGGSTDETLEVLRGFGDQISWVSESDEGHADGVNKGFRRAKGDILGWLNSDDVYFSRGVVGRMVDEFGADPGADVFYGNVATISDQSVILRIRVFPPFSPRRQLHRNIIPQPSVFLRRRVFEAEQLGTHLFLDVEYWARLIARGFRFRHLNIVAAGDRKYAGCISVDRPAELDSTIDELKARYRGKVPALGLIGRGLLFGDRIRARIEGYRVAVQLVRGGDRFLRDLAFPARIDSRVGFLGRQLLFTEYGLRRRYARPRRRRSAT